jgi:thiamine biosynthesis lipoprotein
MDASVSSTLLRDRFAAMGTSFEALLVGERDDDVAHFSAVARTLWEEVARVERTLSRFDPAAEVARLNREAASRPVRASVELLEVLLACRQFRQLTGGYFDVALGAARSPGAIEIDPDRRTIRFAHPGIRLDFGAFGKGYALDRLRPILQEHGVTRALLHGGTSSVLAVGTGPDGQPWRVGLRDPYYAEAAERDRPLEFEQLQLADCALSCSAVFGDGATSAAASDLIDPTTGLPLASQAACVVLARSAAAAEVWSTACLAMGRERAAEHLGAASIQPLRVGWISKANGTPRVDWL